MDLSVHLRRMKFMQRGQSAELNKALEDTAPKTITDEQWELDIPNLGESQSRYDVVQSHVEICDLRYGRMSYQGFNAHTEKMMKIWNNEEEEEKKEPSGNASDCSISDEEMTERYSSLVGTIAKKYGKRRAKGGNGEKTLKSKKRKKSSGKSSFIKPDEDS